MAVLAQDEWTIAKVVAAVHHDGVDWRIHRAHHIGSESTTVAPAGMKRSAFVVQQARRIVVPNPSGQRIVVRAITALVAQRPHDDRGMVHIALDHARAASEPCGAVTIVVAQRGVVRVALDVGFVYYVEPELVTQVKQTRIVGIVRRANRVDVVLFHQHQVGAHVVVGNRLTARGVMVVAIDSEDPHRLTIHEQLTIAHLNMAKPNQLGVYFANRLVGTQHLDNHAISIGVLGRPWRNIGYLKRSRGPIALEDVGAVESVRHGGDNGLTNALAAQRLERGAHSPSALGRIGKRNRRGHRELADTVGHAQVGVAAKVAEMRGGA